MQRSRRRLSFFGSTLTTAVLLASVVTPPEVARDAVPPYGSSAAVENTPAPNPTPDAVWDVPNGTVNDVGATILNNGHVDVASVVDGAALVTRVKDTTQSSEPVWRDPARTVLQLLPGAEETIPTGEQWAFLGEAGTVFHQVSQTQQAGLLWPGWSTEAIGLSVTQGGVDWVLTDASGPGEFALYETGSFGQPSVLFATRDGITDADRITIPKATHAHGSWAFSAEGEYCLGFERSTTLTGGRVVSSEFVLSVAVGRTDVRKIDPSACFRESDDRPEVDDEAPVAEELLTDANRGELVFAAGASRFSPGQLLSMETGAEHSGEWLSVWLHPEPVWLGWTKADAHGVARVRLPVDVEIGEYRVVVRSADLELRGWRALAIIASPAPPPPAPGAGEPPVEAAAPPALEVPATQCAASATILSSGHIDYASRIVGGKLESLVGDDTAGSKVYREPAATILWLKPSSRVTLPSGYGAVGAAGSSVWQIPQTQNAQLIWLGWNTESLNAANARGPVAWTIDSISGPGSVTVYLTGSFGGVQSMIFDGGGSYSIPLGVHAHANWAFSAEGVYRITSTQTATLANGVISQDTETLTIVVGDVDPRSASGGGMPCGTVAKAIVVPDDPDEDLLAAEQVDAAAASSAPEGDGPRTTTRVEVEGVAVDPLIALSARSPVPMLLATLGILLLAGAFGAGVQWWRNARTPLGDAS